MRHNRFQHGERLIGSAICHKLDALCLLGGSSSNGLYELFGPGSTSVNQDCVCVDAWGRHLLPLPRSVSRIHFLICRYLMIALLLLLGLVCHGSAIQECSWAGCGDGCPQGKTKKCSDCWSSYANNNLPCVSGWNWECCKEGMLIWTKGLKGSDALDQIQMDVALSMTRGTNTCGRCMVPGAPDVRDSHASNDNVTHG